MQIFINLSKQMRVWITFLFLKKNDANQLCIDSFQINTRMLYHEPRIDDPEPKQRRLTDGGSRTPRAGI
jgi:hypothetical protein